MWKCGLRNFVSASVCYCVYIYMHASAWCMVLSYCLYYGKYIYDHEIYFVQVTPSAISANYHGWQWSLYSQNYQIMTNVHVIYGLNICCFIREILVALFMVYWAPAGGDVTFAGRSIWVTFFAQNLFLIHFCRMISHGTVGLGQQWIM